MGSALVRPDPFRGLNRGQIQKLLKWREIRRNSNGRDEFFCAETYESRKRSGIEIAKAMVHGTKTFACVGGSMYGGKSTTISWAIRYAIENGFVLWKDFLKERWTTQRPRVLWVFTHERNLTRDGGKICQHNNPEPDLPPIPTMPFKDLSEVAAIPQKGDFVVVEEYTCCSDEEGEKDFGIEWVKLWKNTGVLTLLAFLLFNFRGDYFNEAIRGVLDFANVSAGSIQLWVGGRCEMCGVRNAMKNQRTHPRDGLPSRRQEPLFAIAAKGNKEDFSYHVACNNCFIIWDDPFPVT